MCKFLCLISSLNLMASRCSHFPTNDSGLSFMAVWYSAVHKYHIVFIHSPPYGHAGCFQDSQEPFRQMPALKPSAATLRRTPVCTRGWQRLWLSRKNSKGREGQGASSWGLPIDRCLSLHLFRKYFSVHFSLQSLSLSLCNHKSHCASVLFNQKAVYFAVNLHH